MAVRALDPSHRRVRAARAAAASTLATLVALASHVAAGGAPPSMLLVATVGVLSWWPAILLMGRRPSLAGQALTILLAEAALHATFTLGAAPSSALVVPRPGAVLGPMPGMPAEAPMAAMAAPTAAMWTAHAVAAVLTVVAWNRGEAAFWALVRLAHRLSPVPVPERTHDERPRLRALVATRWDPSPAHHLERVVAVRPRRGPPPVPNR